MLRCRHAGCCCRQDHHHCAHVAHAATHLRFRGAHPRLRSGVGKCGDQCGAAKSETPAHMPCCHATQVWDLRTVACGLCFWLKCDSLAEAAPRFSLPLALPHPSTPHTAYPLTPHTPSYAPHPPVTAWPLPPVASSLLQGAGNMNVSETQQLPFKHL